MTFLCQRTEKCVYIKKWNVYYKFFTTVYPFIWSQSAEILTKIIVVNNAHLFKYNQSDKNMYIECQSKREGFYQVFNYSIRSEVPIFTCLPM